MKISLIKTIYAYITTRYLPTYIQLQVLTLLWICPFAILLFFKTTNGKYTMTFVVATIFRYSLITSRHSWKNRLLGRNLLKADWPSFKALCETEINNTILQANDPIDRFTTTLHQIAIKTIPKTPSKSKKKKKPWFNDDCKTFIQKRKQALRQFNACPLQQNLENFRIFRAKQYVSRLNSRTSIKNVWDMVRNIQGKGKPASFNHLKKNNDNITSKKDIANTLADSF